MSVLYRKVDDHVSCDACTHVSSDACSHKAVGETAMIAMPLLLSVWRYCGGNALTEAQIFLAKE